MFFKVEGWTGGCMSEEVRDLTAPLGTYVIRTATAADAGILRALGDEVFPPDDPDVRRARPGEIEAGAAVGDVRLLQVDSEPVAYLHADRSDPTQIRVAGLAVRPAFQNSGFGTLLLDDFLAALDQGLRARLPVVNLASPRNLIMLRLLFSRGFWVRWILRDHFGPGQDRFGCQLTATGPPPPPNQGLNLSASDLTTVYRLVENENHVVFGVTPTATGPRLELARIDPDQLFPPTGPPRRLAG